MLFANLLVLQIPGPVHKSTRVSLQRRSTGHPSPLVSVRISPRSESWTVFYMATCDNSFEAAQECPRSPGRASGAVWAGNPMRTGQQKGSQTAQASGPGSLGPVFGPSVFSLRPNPVQKRPRKPSPGTASSIKQLEIDSQSRCRLFARRRFGLALGWYQTCPIRSAVRPPPARRGKARMWSMLEPVVKAC